MKIGLVILNYNDYSTTANLYCQIKNYQDIDEIVIVDNCSTDNSFKELKHHCQCHVISTPKNGGYAYGNNYGIHYLKKNFDINYFVISNPDVEFSENTIKSIVKEMKQNSKIGIMSAVMLNKDRKISPSAYGKISSYMDDLIECFYLFRYYRIHKTIRKIDFKRKVFPVDFVWGSFFVISNEAYDAIHGFDENTFLYHEENITAKRLKKKGYIEAILTTQTYIHRHAESTTKTTSILSRHQIGMDSKYYFQTTYNHLNSFQKNLLKLVIYYSIVELKIICFIRKILRKLNF